MDSVNKNMQNKTTPEEVVVLKSNILFDTTLGFDSTLGFTPYSEF